MTNAIASGALILSLLTAAPGLAGDKSAWADVVDDPDELPRLLKQSSPRYPGIALHQGVGAVVDVEFVIDRKGRVREPRLVKRLQAPHPGVVEAVQALEKEALDTVRAYRFTPARKDGQPIATSARVPVSFRITDGRAR